jgi:hypothetical protein
VKRQLYVLVHTPAAFLLLLLLRMTLLLPLFVVQELPVEVNPIIPKPPKDGGWPPELAESDPVFSPFNLLSQRLPLRMLLIAPLPEIAPMTTSSSSSSSSSSSTTTTTSSSTRHKLPPAAAAAAAGGAACRLLPVGLEYIVNGGDTSPTQLDSHGMFGSSSSSSSTLDAVSRLLCNELKQCVCIADSASQRAEAYMGVVEALDLLRLSNWGTLQQQQQQEECVVCLMERSGAFEHNQGSKKEKKKPKKMISKYEGDISKYMHLLERVREGAARRVGGGGGLVRSRQRDQLSEQLQLIGLPKEDDFDACHCFQ